jgi:Protein of unknown function (DUF1579)
MEMPKPNEHHRWLERFAGNWKGEETMHPSAWCPTMTKAEGRMDNRVGLDGFVVITDYEQIKDGAVCFRGHGVYTYDAKENQYLLHWFDVASPKCEIFRGKPNGDSISLTSVGVMGHHRLTNTFSAPGKMTTKMEMSQDGKDWATVLDSSYTRNA